MQAALATTEAVIDSSNATIVDSPAGTIRKQVSPATTPRTKKRARFSDPGLEVELSTSTGLTPALRRHRLVPSPRRSSHHARRRRSLPAELLSPPPYLPVVTVQFRPLRQTIDARSKRRLKRSHLSEEVNDIEKETRAGKKTSKESIAALKDQVEEKDRLFRALKREVMLARRSGVHVPLPPGVTESVGGSTAEDDGNEDDEEEEIMEQSIDGASAAWDMTAEMSWTAGAGISQPQLSISAISNASESRPTNLPVDTEDQQQLAALKVQAGLLRESLRQVTCELEMKRSTHQLLSAKLQSHLQEISFSGNLYDLDAALSKVLNSLVLTQARAEVAEAGLTNLWSEVAGLGFEGHSAEEMIDNIERQFRQAGSDLKYLQPGETAEEFENETLLGLLVDRVGLLLRQIRDSEEEQDSERRVTRVLQNKLDLVEAQAKCAEAKAQELAHEVDEKAQEVDEKERSIGNLQHALEGYRNDVKSLEGLINHLEREHAKKTEELKGTADEAVADLEVKLEAEIKRNEGIVLEAEEEGQLMRELQAKVDKAMTVIDRINQEKETLSVAKDTIIAHLEAEAREQESNHQSTLAEHRRELDTLSREKSTLVASLREAEVSIGTLTNANTLLEARLAVELENGVAVMEKMRSEMMQCLARASELKSSYQNSRGESGPGPNIPMTPCSLRFATPKKKRRKFDSGIGVIDEDDEDMEDC